jgi:hypothetical protein
MKKVKQKNNLGGCPKKSKTQIYRKDTFDNFIEWSILTDKEKTERNLVTAKAFAKKYKITEAQLSKWKKRAEFSELKKERMMDKMRDSTPDVLNAFCDRCKKYGMAHDVELWLLYVEGWDRKHALAEMDKKKLTLAPDDIRVLVERLPKEKQKRFYDTLTELIVEAQEAMFYE